MRLAVVRPFAIGIGVAHQTTEPWTQTSRRPLKHLQITVRIAEREDRSASDKFLNTDRLAWSIVYEFDLLLAH